MKLGGGSNVKYLNYPSLSIFVAKRKDLEMSLTVVSFPQLDFITSDDVLNSSSLVVMSLATMVVI